MNAGELTKIIEALRAVNTSAEWSSLKTSVWNGVVERLERQLVSEATKKPIAPEVLYDLQGQITWAKRYSDLEKLAETYLVQLNNVKLNPPTERDIAPDTK